MEKNCQLYLICIILANKNKCSKKKYRKEHVWLHTYGYARRKMRKVFKKRPNILHMIEKNKYCKNQVDKISQI